MSSPVMPMGAMVWLAQYLIDVQVKAQQTFPDTPNLYSADLRVVGDQGDMDLSALVGRRGRDGQVQFQLRLQKDPPVSDPANLPVLQDTPLDIGKFWLIDDLDANGHVVGQWAWVWWGTAYRKLMCGTVGDPGPVPGIEPHVTLVEPQDYPTYPDVSSHISTSGTYLAPSWNFQLAVPAGAAGAIRPVAAMPDVDLSTPPVVNELLCCTDRFTADGEPIFAPISLRNHMPQPFSVPESAFTAFSGITQQQWIGSYEVADPGFDWTPIVWGHVGGPQTTAASTLNSIQHILVSAYSGTFTLNVNGTDTSPIDFNATGAQIEAAIEAALGGPHAVVDAGVQYLSHLVEFVGSLAGTAVPTMTANTSGLQPAGLASVLIDAVQQGGTLGTTVVEALTGEPLQIGCQALLGDATAGTMVAKGKGNLLGHVNVLPHYSTPDNLGQTITPTNGYAVVKAGASAAERTLHFNLWNDGFFGAYDYHPANSQMFVLVSPIDAANSIFANPSSMTRRRGVAARNRRK